MANKLKLEFEGFEEVISRLKKLEGNTKLVTDKALKKSHEYVTNLAEEGVQASNLPAKGKYSTGDTLKSLYREGKVEWAGTKASVPVGFSIRKGGLPSIFMMYGTPRYMKVQKLYNAFWSSKTRSEVMKIQEDIFYDEIRRLT